VEKKSIWRIKKSSGGGRPTPPDSGGKIKKQKRLSVQQSGVIKLDAWDGHLLLKKRSKKLNNKWDGVQYHFLGE
jgi:hypothetical protein